jgi:hypothetical protein
MTIAVAINVGDSLVLASDSATTQQWVTPAGHPDTINIWNSANKIFNLRKGAPGLMQRQPPVDEVLAQHPQHDESRPAPSPVGLSLIVSARTDRVCPRVLTAPTDQLHRGCSSESTVSGAVWRLSCGC